MIPLWVEVQVDLPDHLSHVVDEEVAFFINSIELVHVLKLVDLVAKYYRSRQIGALSDLIGGSVQNEGGFLAAIVIATCNNDLSVTDLMSK